MIRYRQILQQCNIRLLFLAQSISMLGTWIGLIALNVKVYDLTQSALGVAGVFLSMALPSLVFGLVGGVFVDHVHRGRLLVAADALRMVLAVGMLLADTPAWLYALLLISASGGVFSRMARMAIVPHLAERKEDLLATNSLLNITQTLTLVLGPAIGGALVAAVGVPAALGLDAVSFGLSALLIVRMNIPTGEHEALPRGRTREQLRAGIEFVRGSRPVLSVIIATGVMLLGTGAINALELVYAEQVLGVGEVGFGLLISSWGVGLFFGTLVVGNLGEEAPLDRIFMGSVALLGVTLMLYAGAPSLAVAIVLGIVGGLGNGIQFSLAHALLQLLTPKEMMGRVAGIYTTTKEATTFVSMLAAGLLGDLAGVQPIFVVAGLIVTVAAVLPAVLAAGSTVRGRWLPARIR